MNQQNTLLAALAIAAGFLAGKTDAFLAALTTLSVHVTVAAQPVDQVVASAGTVYYGLFYTTGLIAFGWIGLRAKTATAIKENV
jgi:hypothetical protein